MNGFLFENDAIITILGVLLIFFGPSLYKAMANYRILKKLGIIDISKVKGLVIAQNDREGYISMEASSNIPDQLMNIRKLDALNDIRAQIVSPKEWPRFSSVRLDVQHFSKHSQESYNKSYSAKELATLDELQVIRDIIQNTSPILFSELDKTHLDHDEWKKRKEGELKNVLSGKPEKSRGHLRLVEGEKKA